MSADRDPFGLTPRQNIWVTALFYLFWVALASGLGLSTYWALFILWD